MSTIINRNGKYLVRVRKKGAKPVSKTFTLHKDALAWSRKVESAIESGRDTLVLTNAVPTLHDALPKYRSSVGLQLKGDKDYSHIYNSLASSNLGPLKITDIAPANIAAWRDAMLMRGLKPATVLRHMGFLSAIFTWCLKDMGWITMNPVLSVRRPKCRNHRNRTLTEEELRYLRIAVKSAKASWLADAVELLIGTAMRRSELVSLQFEDVDFSRSVAKLWDTKNGEDREVPLSPTALGTLKRLIDSAKNGQKTVLPISDPEAVSFCFRRAVVRAQERYREDCLENNKVPLSKFLENLRLHDLRHHSITFWASTGKMSVLDLMKISGHKSPKMLARYTHISASDLAKRMATVDQEF
jgi:integrase